jgi:hypothetical protein
MARQRVKFTFAQELIKEPVIYELGKQFQIVTNIRRADVTADRGWVILELDGELPEIERGAARWQTVACASPGRRRHHRG